MEMEELINEWKRFKLMEEEKERIFTLDGAETSEIGGQASHSLVGKLISHRFISKGAMKNSMSSAWKTRKDFNIEIIGNHIFLFIFESKEDRDWIITNGPWFFDKSLLVLEAPNTKQRTMDLDFNCVDFWLRIFNKPICYRNEKIARKIGNGIGEFLEQDTNKNYAHLGNNIRIRVRLNITKPLRRGFMIRLEDSSEIWVTIRYERIPEFCFRCGVIGHIVKDCSRRMNVEDDEEEEFEFGMWMKFQGYTGKTKSQGSPRKETDNTNNQVFDGKTIFDKEDRNNEGLDVDLNLVSPIAEETEDPERVEEGRDRNMNMEVNRTFDEEGSSWDMLQLMEKESQLQQENESLFEVEDSQVVKETPLPKKKSWKRRDRIDQTDYFQQDSSGSKKRKGIGTEGKQRKKVKGLEIDGVDSDDASQELAAAVNQPCQGL